jgi:hypothetical protein
MAGTAGQLFAKIRSCQVPLPLRSQNRTFRVRSAGPRSRSETLTCKNSVELRGFEPLTPSMRTIGNEVGDGRWGRSGAAGGSWWPFGVASVAVLVAVLVSAAIDYPSLGYELESVPRRTVD